LRGGGKKKGWRTASWVKGEGGGKPLRKAEGEGPSVTLEIPKVYFFGRKGPSPSGIT